LPADGFVFWVRADLLAAPSPTSNAFMFQARGSLHHTTVNKQDPDESFSINRMIFTSKDPVDNLAAIAPNSLYLGSTNGQRYAFSARSMWYKQAALYHYSGDAGYPTLATQIINHPTKLNLSDAVVSNSLPIWLSLNKFFPLYPSMLVPDNIDPPYAAVNIGEEDTTPMQSGATHD